MTTAALILFIEERLKTTSEFSLAEILILILAFMFPFLMMMNDLKLPIGSLPLVLLFGLILWREKQCAPSLRQMVRYRCDARGMQL